MPYYKRKHLLRNLELTFLCKILCFQGNEKLGNAFRLKCEEDLTLTWTVPTGPWLTMVYFVFLFLLGVGWHKCHLINLVTESDVS